MKRRLLFFIVFVCLAGFSGTVNAMLWDRGSGLVYDDVFDITWLQDANYAGTSGYTDGLDYGTYTDLSTGESYPIPSGHMIWSDAMDWAYSLVYVGFDDWRLPITDPAVSGFDISSSELGYMYYV